MSGAYQKGYEAGLLRAYEIASDNEKNGPQLPLFPTGALILLELDKGLKQEVTYTTESA